MNRLRDKIERGEDIRGIHVTLDDPGLCAILGRLGFDFIWVDMEHTYIDCRSLYIHLNAAKAVNASIIVRVPQNDKVTLKKVIEMGVDGVIFPMITSVSEASEAIAATFYPPKGNRGFGPRDAIAYGLWDVLEYIEKGSLEMCRFIQVEHVMAVDCMEELAQINGIDGYIFGPNDLSGSIGQLGYPRGKSTEDLMRKAIGVLNRYGKYAGVSTGDFREETLRYFKSLGISMISAGADTDFLLYGAKAALKNLRKV